MVEFSTLVEALSWRALWQPEQRIYNYLLDGETEGEHLTFAALDRQARAIGALLQSHVATGERALLLYPTGLEFIAGFFGCLYAGVIAVPVPPPNPAQPQRTLPRLLAITNDARPTAALTTSSILSKVEGLFTQAPELQTMRWLATDNVAGDPAEEWQDPAATGDSLALLQYTSGSTTTPRGVMVSHANLIRNSAHISRVFELAPDTVSVTWLPAFHDMGLTNGIIQPLSGDVPVTSCRRSPFFSGRCDGSRLFRVTRPPSVEAPISPMNYALAKLLRNNAKLSTSAVGMRLTTARSRSGRTLLERFAATFAHVAFAHASSIRVMDSPKPL